MDKVDVNGKNTIDLYDFLKVQSGHTGTIKWNFTKFVVARDGKTVSRQVTWLFNIIAYC
jgi:glutathione peroxidase